LQIPISIDTTKATVARAAIAMGAEIVNDISGLEHDPEMLDVVRGSGAGVCAMHMQGTPQTMQENPRYENVVDEIYRYLKQRDDFLIGMGIEAAKICLDPGIGFGKSHEHNLELIRSISAFHQIGRPLLVGHSRKGFIAKVIDDRQASRTAGTIGVSLALARQRVQILRIHDVLATRHALLTFEAAGGIDDTSAGPFVDRQR
jgi:dihydropteroate synthase